MATYFTDFSEYTTGPQPSDWTARYEADASWGVNADAGATGGKVLHYAQTGDGLNAITWDVIDSDSNRANVEIVARFRYTEASTAQISLIARASGTALGSSSTQYEGGAEDGGDIYKAAKLNPGYTELANVAQAQTIDTWYWLRFRVNGTTLQVKFWVDGDSEPASWGIETTDSDISAAGWVGIGTYDEDSFEVDLIGIGTNGDTAPTSAPSGSIDRTLTDGIAVADASTVARDAVRALADAVDALDATDAARTLPRTLLEGVEVADQSTSTLAVFREVTLTDGVVVADTVTRAVDAVRPLMDTLATADASVATRNMSRLLEAGVVPGDSLDATLSNEATLIEVNVTDGVAVNDSLGRSRDIPRGLQDAVVVADDAGVSRQLVRLASDGAVVADDALLSKARAPVLTDALTLTDDLAALPSLLRKLTDGVATADEEARTYKLIRLYQEAVEVADSEDSTVVGEGFDGVFSLRIVSRIVRASIESEVNIFG